MPRRRQDQSIARINDQNPLDGSALLLSYVSVINSNESLFHDSISTNDVSCSKFTDAVFAQFSRIVAALAKMQTIHVRTVAHSLAHINRKLG